MSKPLQAHLPIQLHVLSFILHEPMHVGKPSHLFVISPTLSPLLHQAMPPLAHTSSPRHAQKNPLDFHLHTLTVPSPIPLAIPSLPPHLTFTMNEPHPHLLLEGVEHSKEEKENLSTP